MSKYDLPTGVKPSVSDESSGELPSDGSPNHGATTMVNEPVLRDVESPADSADGGVEAFDEGEESADAMGVLPGVEPLAGYEPHPYSSLGAPGAATESADSDAPFEAVDADFASGDPGREEFFGAIMKALPAIVQGGQAIAKIPAVRKAGKKVLRQFGIESGAAAGDSSLLEVVIGADDRVQVTNTAAKPWNGICQLSITSRTGRQYIGTGWLIAPRCVITAGHCVYLHGAGGWAKSIEVSAGRNGPAFPYGRITSTTFRAITQWTRDQNRSYDYGCIILPEAPRGTGAAPFCFNFAARSDAELRSQTLNLSGYPGDKGGITQWFHARQAKGVSAFTIEYDIDTAGGQSGSPVWQYSGGVRTAVGIHTNGSPLGNSATRITPAVAAMLRSWKALGA